VSDELELTTEELDELVLNIPPADRRLITSSADFSVSTLVSMLRESGMIIPRFQRKYVWSDKKASRLIESLIMQCPIPVVYLNRRSDEVLEVVDGNQRINSLRRFMDNNFLLAGLTVFTELNGKSFDNLEQKFHRQVRNRTIRCVIIEPESNSQIKFDVFERLNSGSTPLSPQELRHGLNYGSFIESLEKMTSNVDFALLTSTQKDKRMRRDELALRFFAFEEDLSVYKKPLSEFLSDYLKRNKEQTVQQIDARVKKFKKMLDDVKILLGPNAFRFKAGEKETRKFNTAYYDAISVGYATSKLYKDQVDLKAISHDVANKIEALVEDNDFRNNTLRATSDKAAIESRISTVRMIFDGFV